jgi:hypothetical protein
MRIFRIYYITKKEILEGVNIYDYIPIIYNLIKEQDYEAAEGIKLAIADLGLKFDIPNTDEELEEFYKFYNKQNYESHT